MGEKPSRLAVFEYEIEVQAMRGVLTRLPDVASKAIFSAEYGYHEAVVSDLPSLRQFMAQVQDISSARLDGNALRLAGRQPVAATMRNLQVEEVATIFQAQEKLTNGRSELLARFDREIDDLGKVWQAKLDALGSDPSPNPYGVGATDFPTMPNKRPAIPSSDLQAELAKKYPGIFGKTKSTPQFELPLPESRFKPVIESRDTSRANSERL